MRLSQFVTGLIVAVVALVVGISLLGEGSIIRNYHMNAGLSDTLNESILLYDTVGEQVNNSKTNTLGKDTDAGQGDDDESSNYDTIWTYQAKGFKEGMKQIFSAQKTETAIHQIGNYLQVNFYIITGIIVFLIMAIVFAVIRFLRGVSP